MTQAARLVVFDCDSTLSAVEGIDLLAERAGVREQTTPLTQAAMEGEIALEDVYRRRLELIRPNRDAVAWLGEQYVARRVIGARETVEMLHAAGRTVHILSSGIRQAVLTLARSLEIPGGRVHAVEVLFDVRGEYSGFDERSPLAASGGKAEICRRLLRDGGSAIMVGDGVTDLEAAQAGAIVIGFGGIVRREAVARRASRYVDAPNLTAVLDAILSPAERKRLTTSAARASAPHLESSQELDERNG